jgi:hypothetical protein
MKTLKIFKFVFVVFVSVLFVSGCEQSAKHSASIKGQLKNSNGEILTLFELGVDEMKTVDSLVIKGDGSFEFSFSPDYKGFYVIEAGKNKFIKLVVGKGDQLHISGDCDNFEESYSVVGSDNDYHRYEMELLSREKEIDSLSIILMESRSRPDFMHIRDSIDGVYNKILEEHYDFSLEYVSMNASDLSALMVLNSYLGNKPVFEPVRDIESYILIDSALKTKYKNNPHYKLHAQRLEKIKEAAALRAKANERLSIGNKFPELIIEDDTGIRNSLYEMSTNYVLVLVYSHEDRSSRKFINDLKVLGLDKKLGIYAVSLDERRELWKNNMTVKELEAVHVCDGLGYSSPVVKLLAVDKLPVTYLLDINMNIQAKNLIAKELEVLLR